MDNTTENINNPTHSLIEPRKLQGDGKLTSEYDTFIGKNDEEKDYLPGGVSNDLDNSELEKHPPYVYSKIMKHRSKYHVLASLVYFLSLIMFEFLILQFAMMLLIIFNIEKIEMITFLALTFLGIAFGWVAKNFIMEDLTLRRNIFMTCIITFILTIFLIATRSSYIMFITYPAIALGCSIIFFASKQIYDDYYHTSIHELKNPSRFTKNILISLSMIGSFIAFFVMWMCSKGVFDIWYIEMLVFSLLVALIGTLVYFASDSPISIYRTQRASAGLFNLLEEIIEGKLDEDKRERVLDELKIITTKYDSFNYLYLFEGENKNSTIIFFIITLCTAYVNFTVLTSVPRYTYLNIPIGTPDIMSYYFLRMLILLLISGFGSFIGALLVNWVNTRKYLFVPSYFIISALLILMTIFKGQMFLYAGAVLFFVNLATMILLNYAYESYEAYLNEKAARTYVLVYYLGAAVGLIIFQSFYAISPTVGFSTISFFSLSAAVLGFFMKH
jgi:MFS family permease